MKRFKNILLVYNNGVGDDDTLSQAVALAKRNDAELTMVEIVTKTALPAREIAELHKHLSRMIASIQNEGVKASTAILEGTSFLEIIRQVLRRGHDLVDYPCRRRRRIQAPLLWQHHHASHAEMPVPGLSHETGGEQ